MLALVKKTNAHEYATTSIYKKEIQMKKLKYIIFAIVAFTICGCGTSAYVIQDSKPDVAACKINVFRDQFTLIWSMNIQANGRTFAKLSDGSYTSFYLEAGEQKVKAAWNFLAGGVNLEVPFQCANGETVNIAFWGYVDGNQRTINGGILTQEAAEKRLETYKKAGS